MSAPRKCIKPRMTSLLLLLVFAGVWPSGTLLAHSRTSVSVGIAFGGHFPAPVYGFGGYYYPTYYPGGAYVPGPGRPYYTFVDTDIHPEDATVSLDGKPIGVADDFDGFPGYLVLKPGRHDLVFSLRGYRSLRFNLRLRPGEMADLDRTLPRLAPGERDDVPPKIHSQGDIAEKAGPTRAESGRNLQDRHTGALLLHVSPPDARVILDGDFFATGAEISRLHGGIPLSAGLHRIRVSCDGFESKSREISVEEGTGQTLEISLRKR